MIPEGMICWNGLTAEQQEKVIITGIFAGYDPNPDPDACREPATVGIERAADRAPGCRYYCLACGRAALA